MELFHWPSLLLFSGINRKSVCWKILQDSKWIGSEESSGKLFGISWRHLCRNTFLSFAQRLIFCAERLGGPPILSKENPLFSNFQLDKKSGADAGAFAHSLRSPYLWISSKTSLKWMGGDLTIVISMTCGNKCYLLNLDHFKKGRAQCIRMAAVVGVRW